MRNAGNDNHSSSFSSSKLRQLQIGKHDNLNGIERKRKKKCLRLPSSMTPFVLGEKVETFDLYYCQKSDMNFSPIVVVKA